MTVLRLVREPLLQFLLVGLALFKHVSSNHIPLSHLVGLAILALVASLAGGFAPLTIAALATATLILVAAWEHVSLGGPAKA